jgi:hypothetical protein
MTTSGVSVFTQSRDDLIKAAMRKCGVLAEGITPSAQMINDAADDLNRMIKGFQAEGGVKLWAYDELVLFLVPGQQSYALGPGGDRCVRKADLVSAASSADAIVGATAVTLADTSKIVNGMNIGVLCDDNTLFWTTVSGLVGNVATLAAALTVQASSGAQVWAYVNAAPRPLRIEQARIQTSPTSEIEMTKQGREDYFRIPNKTADGTPVQYYYDPTLVTGTFYAWPLTEDQSQYINLTAYRALQVFTKATDTADISEECQQALIWNLASEIMMEYGLDAQTMAVIQSKADKWLATIETFDVDDASLIFMPDMR